MIEKGDEEEKSDGFAVAVDLGFLVIVGIEVDVGEGDEVEFVMIVILFSPFVVVHVTI